MIRPTVLAAAAVTSLASAAAAQPPASAHLSPQFMACFQRAGSNAVQRDVCAQREVGAQDDRLNKAYKQVMGQLAKDSAAHAALRDDERRWITQRDYECKVNDQTVNEACVVMKTAQRADELESRVRF